MATGDNDSVSRCCFCGANPIAWKPRRSILLEYCDSLMLFAAKISTLAHKAESTWRLRCFPVILALGLESRIEFFLAIKNLHAAADVLQLGCYIVSTLTSTATAELLLSWILFILLFKKFVIGFKIQTTPDRESKQSIFLPVFSYPFDFQGRISHTV